MSETTEIQAHCPERTDPAPAGAIVATFAIKRKHNHSATGERCEVTNTITLRQVGESFIDHETGADGYSAVRAVKPAPVRVIQTTNLAIRATPTRPQPARRSTWAYSDSVEYNGWEHNVSATVGGKPVALDHVDLMRLGVFCNDVAERDGEAIKAY